MSKLEILFPKSVATTMDQFHEGKGSYQEKGYACGSYCFCATVVRTDDLIGASSSAIALTSEFLNKKMPNFTAKTRQQM